MKPNSILVRAFFDEEASVWVATSPDIDGLSVEAETMEQLEGKVAAAVSDLIELNRPFSHLPEIPLHILSEHVTHIPNPDRR